MDDKRITIKEIALLAGVSVGTVHGALYNKPGFSGSPERIITGLILRRRP